MTETVLELADVQTYYGHIHALRGVNLSVRQGQVVALLGANGAGKSTTLRTISGLVPARSGRIVFEGADITRQRAHLTPRMGLIQVPEGRRIFKGMSVRENLELGSFTLADEAERQSRLARVFSTFPVLEARQRSDASQLSGGEQQMLAIGRALMAGPRLLLLDEPSMGLAPRLVREIMRIIRRLNEAGTTILLVEQNTKVALQIAHYGYVLETGRIVAQGDAAVARPRRSGGEGVPGRVMTMMLAVEEERLGSPSAGIPVGPSGPTGILARSAQTRQRAVAPWKPFLIPTAVCDNRSHSVMVGEGRPSTPLVVRGKVVDTRPSPGMTTRPLPRTAGIK